MSDDAALTLVVAELDCADEAAQIEGALGRLPAVTGVRTSVGAHKVFVTYDPGAERPRAHPRDDREPRHDGRDGPAGRECSPDALVDRPGRSVRDGRRPGGPRGDPTRRGPAS
jgi:copper chaperone CopZ